MSVLVSLVPLLSSVFSASLLGSLHCAGMCGPFVAVYAAAAPMGSRPRARAHLHVAYQAGRAVTYATVGAISGFLGSLVDLAGKAAGAAHVAAIATSVLLVLWGVGVIVPRFAIKSPWDGVFGRRLVQLRRRSPLVRASLLGTLTPLLPCGWFYAFALTAAGTARAAHGALVMTVFWLGTVPALLGVGWIMGRSGGWLRQRLPVLTGTLLIVIGLLGVITRVERPLPSASPDASTLPTLEKPACH